jgi:hypothetical protein
MLGGVCCPHADTDLAAGLARCCDATKPTDTDSLVVPAQPDRDDSRLPDLADARFFVATSAGLGRRKFLRATFAALLSRAVVGPGR